MITAVSAAPAGDIFVGHGDEIHVLHLQPAQIGSLGEPQNVLQAQVRLHILLEHLDELIDLGDILQLQQLFQHGGQKGLLSLDAAQIAVGIAVVQIVVVAVAQYAHGLLSVEFLIALADMDGQVLIGVVVIHVPGHVEPHPAHGVHNLTHGLPLDDHLVVRLKAHQLGDLLIEVLNTLVSPAAVIVYGVDALDVVGHIHHGIPGDGHDRGLLVGHVIACQQHGVGVAAATRVPAQNQDRIVVLTFPLAVAAGTGPLTPVNFFRLAGLRVGDRGILVADIGPNKQALTGGHNDNQHRRQGDQQLLLASQSARLLWPFLLRLLCFPFSRQMLSSFSFHGLVYPFNASRASMVAWCTGFPIAFISPMVISRPIKRPLSKSS